MPANLDTPIDIQSGPSTTSEISILEIVIRPYEDVTLAIAQGDGATSHRIPGMFTLDDCDAHEETIGGRVFTVAAGDYFSDAIASAPVGATMFDAVKAGCYSALMAKYPDLQGNVT